MNEDLLIHISKYHGSNDNDGLTRATALHTGHAAFIMFVGCMEEGDKARFAIETETGEWEYT